MELASLKKNNYNVPTKLNDEETATEG